MEVTNEQRKAARTFFGILESLYPEVSKLRGWYLDVFLPTVERWVESEGNQGVKRIKKVTLLGLQSLWMGPTRPEDISHREPYLSVDSHGWPTLIKPLIMWCMNEAQGLDPEKDWSEGSKLHRIFSVLLSFHRISDLYPGEVSFDYVKENLDVIRSTLSSIDDSLLREYEEFLDSFGVIPTGFKGALEVFSSPIKFEDKDSYFYSESSGPNGSLIGNCYLDYLTLKESRTKSGSSLLDGIISLEQSILEAAGYAYHQAGNPFHLLEKSVTFPLPMKPHSASPGKLSFISEKAGKVRIVAMPDYFSQAALAPVHRWLMSVLRHLPTDHTYDQRRAIPKIQSWQRQKRFIASYDQSQCTDRFPFNLQLAVISRRFGNKFSGDLETVMVDRDWGYSCPGLEGHHVLRWGTGQPMGLKCSWPLMALTHHVIVQFSAWKGFGKPKNFQGFYDYVICGDDIVIASQKVGESYEDVCTRFGMVINRDKSWISPRGSLPTSEFTKVIVRNGLEVPTVKPNEVLSVVNDTDQAPTLFRSLANLGLPLRRIKRIISNFFPSRSKLLTSMLTIPTCLGGCGLHDSRSLRSGWFLSNNPMEIHPMLYYVTAEARRLLKSFQAHYRKGFDESRESLRTERFGEALWRVHPFYRVNKHRSEITGRVWNRSRPLPVPQFVAQVIRSSGDAIEALSRLIERNSYLDDSIPPWCYEERAKEQKGALWAWSKALRQPHFFDEKEWINLREDFRMFPGLEHLKMFMDDREPFRSRQFDRLCQLLTSMAK